MASSADQTPPVIVGTILGAIAWVLGYVIFYIITASQIRESGLSLIIELTEGESAVYELVGWVFFNAHFVDIVYTTFGRALPASYLGGEEGFTLMLYILPPALLLASGLAMGRFHGVTGQYRGAMLGALVAPGYFILCVIGVFLFQVSAVGSTGAPDFLPAVIFAGIIYPALFGGIGGVIAGLTAPQPAEEPVEGS